MAGGLKDLPVWMNPTEKMVRWAFRDRESGLDLSSNSVWVCVEGSLNQEQMCRWFMICLGDKTESLPLLTMDGENRKVCGEPRFQCRVIRLFTRLENMGVK